MTRKSKRELDRKLDEIEQEPDVDAAAVQELWIRSIQRAQGDVEDPIPEDEFDDLWNRTMRAYESSGGR